MNEMKTKLTEFFKVQTLNIKTTIKGVNNAGEKVIEKRFRNAIGELRIRIRKDGNYEYYIATFKPTDMDTTSDVYFAFNPIKEQHTIRFKFNGRQHFLENSFLSSDDNNVRLMECIERRLWFTDAMHHGCGWDLFHNELPEEFITV